MSSHPLHPLLDAWRPPHGRVPTPHTRDLHAVWGELVEAARALDGAALHAGLDCVYAIERERVLGEGMGGDGVAFANRVRAESAAHYGGVDRVNRARMALRRWADGEAERAGEARAAEEMER